MGNTNNSSWVGDLNHASVVMMMAYGDMALVVQFV